MTSNLRKIVSGRFVSTVINIVNRWVKLQLPAMLLGITILTIHQRAWATGDDGIADPPSVSILAGSTSFGHSSLPLQVGNAVDQIFQPGYESDKKIKNIITLSVWEETNDFIPDSFSAAVYVRINYGDDATSAANTYIDRLLEVTYTKAEGAKYNAKQYFSFDGAKYVKITVLGINAPTRGSYNTLNALVLENEMRVTRYYTLKSGVTPSTFTTDPALAGDDELNVYWTWPQDAGYTHTQLEWTWLEDELAPGSIDYDLLFRNNATRIDLPAGVLSYKIPLLYGDTGKLYCRVRAVNINKNGSRTDGPWSTPQIRSFIGHNRALNWQSMITFAEEGKRKAVIQYYDGSLRSRQTVTKNNTTNTIVTAETFYDGQGRAAVAVLPAPGTSNKIGYTPGLNLFTSNTQLNLPANQALSDDPTKYFDMQPIATATSITPALDTNAGTSRYYSGGNPELSAGANAHIPNAEGYPYTVTRYMPDATGRVMSQSGLGAAMQLGKGHEAKYFYGTPAQVELDGLFGTEVGNYTHYYKNMVKDANGQMSVNYVDMHGRTIATALAGDPPTNLVGLDLANQYPYAQDGSLAADLTLNTVTSGDYKATNSIILDLGFESDGAFAAEIAAQTGGASQVTRNLLDNNSNITKNNSIEAINSLLVPATTSYSFKYELTPQSLSLPSCTGGSVCYDCLYDLEISITDESGDQDPIIRRFKNVSLRSGDDCNSGSAPSVVKDTFINVSNITCDIITNHEIKFCESLQPGSYTVRKTLTINDSAMQAFKDLYLTKGLCKTEQQLIDSVYAALLTVSTCDDAPPANNCTDCLTKLGNESDYRTDYLISIGNPTSVPDDIEKQIAASYKAAKLNCDKLCNTSSQVLATKRLMMLADMVPYSGQYAKETGSGEMYNKYNIFSTANTSSFAQPFYKTPRNSSGPDLYRTSNGTVDYAIQPDGTIANLAATTQEAFTDQFAYSWAESLLPYHPEYPKLVYAENNLTTSYNWITTFNNTTTYADAASKGYIFTADGNLSDPLYSQATTYRADMVTKINSNYKQNLSLWQIAYGDAACKDIIDPTQKNNCYTSAPKTPAATTSPYFNDLNITQKNQAWITFRNLYAMERDNHLNAFISDNVTLADNQQLIDQGYLLHFASNDQMAQQYGNNQQSTIGENSWTWYPTTPGGEPNISNIPEASSPAQTYASRCNSYVTQWVQSLTQCTALIGNPDSAQIVNLITAGMVNVCQKGSDASNPFGSSTVATGVAGSPGSFEEVITNVFLQYHITWDNFCNPFVIEFPKPYNKGPVFTKQVIAAVDTCNCSRFAKLKTEAQENGANPAILSSFNQYLRTKYHDTLTQVLFNGLVNGCPQINNNVCYDAMVPTTMACGNTPPCGCEFVSSSGNNCNYNCPQRICNPVNPYPLTSAQTMPDFLNCGFDAKAACVTCATLSSLTAEFKALMPSPYNAGPVFTNSNLTETNIRDNIAFAQFLNYRTGMQYTWMDYAKAAAAAGCNLADYSNNSGATQPVICADTMPLSDATDMYVSEQPCQKVYNMAVSLAQQLYEQRTQNLLASFEEQYRAKCLAVQDIEQFSVKYSSKEYHYTLYYYDMSGNLVTTVPPKGVNPRYNDSFLDSVKNGRTTNTRVAPPHTFLTNYRYNSFNKVIAQNSPDGGTSAFWYDNLANMVIGQNAQQAVDGKYSYTLFDELGRVIEVGQKPQSTGMSQVISQDPAVLNNWLNASGGVKEQLTITAYDIAYPILVGTYMTQQNMRNRISYRATKKLATDDLHYTATFFTYDIHGNIDTVLQDYREITEMTGSNNRFKLMTYDYDLVSGKVRLLSYQPGQPDAFYHRYTYDAENRTVKVETSRDKIYWDQDAAYRYYKHGQLARAELGQLKVQGIDYAYTVQGWKKGINSTTIGDGAFDIGQDGFASSNNSNVARDVYGFALHYFDAVNGNPWSDYTPIGGTSAFARPDAGSNFVSLYNGNIGGISMNNAGFGKAAAGTTNTLPLFYNYRYDQLNRLVSMQAYKGLNTTTNQWSALAMTGNDYAESITYDPNGNILSYNRKGDPEIGKPADMDALTYNYDANKNRLNYINDGVTSTYTEDLETQSVNNYTYYENGNLKTDFAAGITDITWTAYGKLASISKGSNTTTFTYDASTDRITKTADGTTTIYVRDATGNVMSVYTKPTTGSLQQAETDLYGTGRLGIATTITQAPQTIGLQGSYGVAIISTFTRNEKIFELNNHLGNVLVTIGDKKIQHSSNGTAVDYYNADIFNANDYYPFGMIMPGRTYAAASSYRYGFNGKENDNDIKGEGNQQDYGMRIYDPRIGKFLSVDPLTATYPWYTPYQFAGNKPINSIDQDGLEEYETYDDYAKAKGKDALKVMDGSDGAWLASDRKGRNAVWSNAMEAITKNGWKDRLRDNPGPEDAPVQMNIGSAFGVVRDYYLWVQSKVDALGYKSRWAKGAAYLVDELADTYEEGPTSGALYPRMGRLLKDLNFGIADYAVKRFHDLFYEGDVAKGNSYLAWYEWDKEFITYEQGPQAQKVYSQYIGTRALEFLNDLSRQQLTLGAAGLLSKHVFPNFTTLDYLDGKNKAEVNNTETHWAVYYRTNIPLFMLYPSTHGTVTGIKLNGKQQKEMNDAYKGINDFYESSKIKK